MKPLTLEASSQQTTYTLKQSTVSELITESTRSTNLITSTDSVPLTNQVTTEITGTSTKQYLKDTTKSADSTSQPLIATQSIGSTSKSVETTSLSSETSEAQITIKDDTTPALDKTTVTVTKSIETTLRPSTMQLEVSSVQIPQSTKAQDTEPVVSTSQVSQPVATTKVTSLTQGTTYPDKSSTVKDLTPAISTIRPALPFCGKDIFTTFLDHLNIAKVPYDSFEFNEDTNYDLMTSFVLDTSSDDFDDVQKLALVHSKIFNNLLTRLRFLSFAYKLGMTIEGNNQLCQLFLLTNYEVIINVSYIETNWRSIDGTTLWMEVYANFDWERYSFKPTLKCQKEGLAGLFLNYFEDMTTERNENDDIRFILQSAVCSFDLTNWDFRFQSFKHYFDSWLMFYRQRCSTTETCIFPRYSSFLSASEQFFFSLSLERIIAFINVLVYQEREIGISMSEGIV